MAVVERRHDERGGQQEVVLGACPHQLMAVEALLHDEKGEEGEVPEADPQEVVAERHHGEQGGHEEDLEVYRMEVAEVPLHGGREEDPEVDPRGVVAEVPRHDGRGG